MIDYGTSQNVEQSRVDAQTIVGDRSKAVRIITATTLDGLKEHLGLHSSMVQQRLINRLKSFCVYSPTKRVMVSTLIDALIWKT